MKFVLAIFAVFFTICLVPDGRSSVIAADPETETLYTSHPCETSRWYFETSDADSVTVKCYHPDPPQPDRDSE
jgi:hypothetical protein